MDQPTQQPSTKRTLYALIILFSLPIILAIYYYNKGEPIGNTTNHGELISPMQVTALQITDDFGKVLNENDLSGIWTLVYVPPKQCANDCLQKLYYLRQIQTAMGKRQNRLRRVALTFATTETDPQLKHILKQQYPNTQLWLSQANILVNEDTKDQLKFEENHTYLIDPQGNLMMHYNNSIDPNDILEDLGKLIKD